MALFQTLKAGITDRLRQFVPLDLFLPGMPLSAPTIVHIPRFPCSADEARALAATIPKARDVALIIPSASLLHQQITLIAAAVAEADAAIALRLRQTMPKQAEGLVWRKLFGHKSGKGVTFNIYVAKAEQLRALVDEFGLTGHRVRKIETEMNRMQPFYMLGQDAPGKRLSRNIAIGLVIIGLVWAAISLQVKTTRLKTANEALSTEVGKLQDQAVQARSAAASEAQNGAVLQVGLASLNLQRQRLNVLSTMTEKLPDTVWISELTMSNGTLYLSGFASTDVRDVLENLRSLPWVKSVTLDGPIIPDSLTGESRFQLVVDLANSGGRP